MRLIAHLLCAAGLMLITSCSPSQDEGALSNPSPASTSAPAEKAGPRTIGDAIAAIMKHQLSAKQAVSNLTRSDRSAEVRLVVASIGQAEKSKDRAALPELYEFLILIGQGAMDEALDQLVTGFQDVDCEIQRLAGSGLRMVAPEKLAALGAVFARVIESPCTDVQAIALRLYSDTNPPPGPDVDKATSIAGKLYLADQLNGKMNVSDVQRAAALAILRLGGIKPFFDFFDQAKGDTRIASGLTGLASFAQSTSMTFNAGEEAKVELRRRVLPLISSQDAAIRRTVLMLVPALQGPRGESNTPEQMKINAEIWAAYNSQAEREPEPELKETMAVFLRSFDATGRYKQPEEKSMRKTFD